MLERFDEILSRICGFWRYLIIILLNYFRNSNTARPVKVTRFMNIFFIIFYLRAICGNCLRPLILLLFLFFYNFILLICEIRRELTVFSAVFENPI